MTMDTMKRSLVEQSNKQICNRSGTPIKLHIFYAVSGKKEQENKNAVYFIQWIQIWLFYNFYFLDLGEHRNDDVFENPKNGRSS